MDARQIIDYAAEDNAKDFREALYASIYDKINSHIETMKQGIAHNLVTQEAKECECDDDEKEGHEDEKEDKALVKKMVKKDALKNEEVELTLEDYSLEEIEEYMQTEDFDQLDEVSKETLKSYVKKAAVDAGTDQLKMVRKDKDDKVKTGAPKEGPDYRNIGKQREKGISKALDKLTKEDVEQIDELSIQTMKSAKDKLAGKAIAAHYDDNKVAARNLANRALKIGKKVDRKEWQQTNQKRLDQTAKYQKEDIEEIEEAVTRKHFQMVADLIKSHEDPAKRKELAQHHAEIFKQQNPRFDHAKFMKAAGASE